MTGESAKKERDFLTYQEKCEKTHQLCMIKSKDSGLNPSFIKIGCELCERKKKKERYGKIAAWGMGLGFLPVVKLFFLNYVDVNTLINALADPLSLMGLILLFFSCAFYKVYYEKAKEKYDSLREEISTKLWLEPCSCWSVCNHKEEFMAQMYQLGIKLYWK